MVPSPSRPACFLTLPYELRSLIYRFYFELDGGYVFNQEDPYNGKLAAADGQAINLSLMQVCRLIAAETKDLPLQLNIISFSTAYHTDLSPLAGRFEYLSILSLIIERDLAANLSRFITPQISSAIALKFPHFVPVLGQFESWIDNIGDSDKSLEVPQEFISKLHKDGLTGTFSRRFQGYSPDNELYSTFQPALTYTLSLLRQKEPTRFEEYVNLVAGRFKPHEFDNLRLDPWVIPSPAELATVGHQLQDEEVWEALQKWTYPKDEEELSGHFRAGIPDSYRLDETRSYMANNVCFRQAFHFSAAAVAIRFLERLSPAHRLNLRRIMLHEDHTSVGRPECHALGLIRFCRENPRLRVERHVALWTNLVHVRGYLRLSHLPEMVHDATKGELDFCTDHESIETPLGLWFGEALAAVDAGMPAGSFTLVLDGNPDVNLSSEIFQHAVQRNVATEQAFRRCFRTDPDSPGEYHLGEWAGDNLIRGMDHLNNQASVIQCNFNPGPAWDVDKIVEERREWPMEGWENEFGIADAFNYNGGFCNLKPPMPTWSSLLLENCEQRVVPRPPKRS